MRKAIWAALAVLTPRRPGIRPELSIAPRHHHRAVLRRRSVGCDGADPGRADEDHARRSVAGRERDGGGRLGRRRPRGAVAARRLHDQFWPSRYPRRQRRDLQARLRPRHRSRTGSVAAEQPDDHRQQERSPGHLAEGIDRLAEGAAVAADGGHRGRGLRKPHRRALFRERRRHQAAIRAVSRHRSRNERSRRRPDRPDRRPDLELDHPGARGQHPRLCHHRFASASSRRPTFRPSTKRACLDST